MQTNMGLGLSAIGRHYTPWWDARADMALDFVNDRYMYGRKVSTRSAMLSSTRAGAAAAFGGDGAYYTFADNEPLLIPGTGLHPTAALQNKVTSANVNTSGTITADNGPAGAGTAYRLTANGASTANTYCSVPGVAAGTVCFFGAYVKYVNHNNVVLTARQMFGGGAEQIFFDALNGVFGAQTAGVISKGAIQLAEGFWLLWFTAAAGANFNSLQISMAQTGSGFGTTPAGDAFIFWRPTVIPVSRGVHPLSVAMNTTLAASVDTVPDFAAKAAALGLGGGFAGKAVIDLTRLSYPDRYIFSAGVGLNDWMTLYITAANRVLFVTRQGGGSYQTLFTSSPIGATGPRTIEFGYKPAGGSYLDVVGVSEQSGGAAFAMPPLNVAYIGQNIQASAHINDPLHELHLWAA